jgi:hypothetical protein
MTVVFNIYAICVGFLGVALGSLMAGLVGVIHGNRSDKVQMVCVGVCIIVVDALVRRSSAKKRRVDGAEAAVRPDCGAALFWLPGWLWGIGLIVAGLVV